MLANFLLLSVLATLTLAAPPTPINELAARQSSAADGGLSSLLGGAGGSGQSSGVGATVGGGLDGAEGALENLGGAGGAL
ncbi:unnamed protein product [Discula destructiva]